MFRPLRLNVTLRYIALYITRPLGLRNMQFMCLVDVCIFTLVTDLFSMCSLLECAFAGVTLGPSSESSADPFELALLISSVNVFRGIY